MSNYNNIDVILNDYRISELFENFRDTVDVLYECYMEGFFDIGEYETLVKEAGEGKMSKKVADGWAIAKKYLHADVKDIPKMISDAKKQCNMRKLTDEFKIKEILRDGEKIKQIEVEGMKVDIIKSDQTLAAATDKGGSAMILINDKFFDLPLNIQRFTLYHEFAHIKLHSFNDERFTKNIADIETCKGIVRDIIRQNFPDLSLSYDKDSDTYNEFSIQIMYKGMIDNINKAIKNGAIIDNNRAKIRKECLDYLKKNPKYRKYMTNIDKGEKAYSDYDKKLFSKNRDKKSYNKELNKAELNFDKAANKVLSLSHLSPMEVEADRYAANKIGAKNSKKVLSNNKLTSAAVELELENLINSKKLNEKSRNILNKAVRPASKYIAVLTPKTEPKMREKIIQDREKDRQKAIKNKKAEAKAKKKEAKKQAKVQESVMESIFSNLNNYYSEGYISESCYNKCVNMFDEWETYSYSWEL